MKTHVKPGWELTEGQRVELRDLVAAVDCFAGEHDPRFLALLGYWQSCKAPWDALPVVPAYRCKDATWLTAGVGPVLVYCL